MSDSGELETIEYFLEKIGGSDEYKAAVLVAALIKTFEHAITYYCVTRDAFTFNIKAQMEERYNIDVTFHNVYLELFMEVFNKDGNHGTDRRVRWSGNSK